MRKITKIRLLLPLVIGLGAAAVLVAKLVFAAGTASLSLTPATATFSQGDTISVNIYEDSGSDMVNAVQANFSYPSNLLSYTGVTNSSAFSVVAQDSVSGGNAKIARGTTTPVSGNQLVATVRFTATAAGQVNLSFASGSAVVRSTDNGAETLTQNGATYSINSKASLYITPATKTFNKGDSISAVIYENSGSDSINAVQANLSYPSNLLTYVSIDNTGSAFSIQAQNTGGSGSVKVGRGTATPVTGAQLVATVHFTAAAAGTANIAFASGSAVVRSSDNGGEALIETGASYTISAPAGSGSSSSSSSSSSSPKPSTSTTTNSSGTGSSNSTSTPSSTSNQPPVTTNSDNQAPAISKITVTNLSLKTATIIWHTSEPSTSEVDFGLDNNYILSVTDPKLTKDHSVSINSKDLLPHKTYHFQIKSVDAAGNLAVSKDMTFKTEPVSSKAKYGNFWAAFAVIVIIGAAAYVGAGYIRRMKNQMPAVATGPVARSNGGAVVKPSEPDSVMPEPAVVTPQPEPASAKETASKPTTAKSDTTKPK